MLVGLSEETRGCVCGYVRASCPFVLGWGAEEAVNLKEQGQEMAAWAASRQRGACPSDHGGTSCWTQKGHRLSRAALLHCSQLLLNPSPYFSQGPWHTAPSGSQWQSWWQKCNYLCKGAGERTITLTEIQACNKQMNPAKCPGLELLLHNFMWSLLMGKETVTLVKHPLNCSDTVERVFASHIHLPFRLCIS